jgi:hypothetical protein
VVLMRSKGAASLAERWGDSADYLYYPTLPLEEFTLHDCLDTLEEIHDSLRGDL